MTLSRTLRVLQAGLLALLVQACAATPFWELEPAGPAAATPTPIQTQPLAATRVAAETERSGTPGGPTALAEAEGDRLVYFRDMRGASALSARALAGRDFGSRTLGLDFVDAPAGDVARAVIGEALGEPVAVASGVSGRITLTAPEPAPVRIALSALETVLGESGLALVERDEGFLLTTLGAASSGGGVPNAQLGYGARIVAVRHTTPSALVPLIEPFVTEQVNLSFDDDAGVIILTGPGPEVSSAQNAISLFDAPFLTDRVFGMFELRYVDAATAKAEIDSLLSGMGVASGTVRTLALPRLNLLFAASRDRARFDDIGDWLERIDRPSGGDERRLRYYSARNTAATILARQISAAFAGSSGDDAATGLPRFSGDAPAQGQDGGAETGGRLTIIPDELNNGLIIRATDQEYREIIGLVEHMDIMPPQVLIEATIAEVRLTDALSYGVRWFFETTGGEGTSQFSLTDAATNAFGASYPGFNYAFVGSDINAALSALSAVTDVTVLSAPSIMVQNNQTANLQVGDEVPIITQTAQSVSNPDAPLVSSVTLRETGVILEVTPRINASGMVVLDVMQEVSSVRPNTTSGIDSPTIQQLRFTSTVAVRSRSTIALGGLIREQRTETGSGVPGLSRVPGLGNLFRARDVTAERSELVIFLTPRIISSESEVDEALQQVRRQLQELEARQPDLFDR